LEVAAFLSPPQIGLLRLLIVGEWFLMWQSKLWPGQEAFFRVLAVVSVVLVDHDVAPENWTA
jgi:predicted small integral membrane protein